jgi:hypothetical protein
MEKYLLSLCPLFQFLKYFTMKSLLLLVLAMASCRVTSSNQNINLVYSDKKCCKIYENTQPVDFSKMKVVLENNDSHLLDVYTAERTSGRPDLDLTFHFFKTEDGTMVFEQKVGKKPIKHFVTTDSSIFNLVKGLNKTNYYQQDCNDVSTLSINKFFEVKFQGIVLQSCSLNNGGSENICDEDKIKILSANKVFEQMRRLAKYK